jgi:hypothetical protein
LLVLEGISLQSEKNGQGVWEFLNHRLPMQCLGFQQPTNGVDAKEELKGTDF